MPTGRRANGTSTILFQACGKITTITRVCQKLLLRVRVLDTLFTLLLRRRRVMFSLLLILRGRKGSGLILRVRDMTLLGTSFCLDFLTQWGFTDTDVVDPFSLILCLFGHTG